MLLDKLSTLLPDGPQEIRMRHHLPLIATLLALCACATQTSLQPATQDSGAASTATTAKNGRLFVSDPSNGDVTIYDIPGLRLVTILQTFKRPQGECADFDGNVWVVDAGTRKIDKLDYEGKTIGRLGDRNGTPYSCAWDGSTGDLAVTNSAEKSYTGALLVYRQAMGSPISIQSINLRSYDFAGYDQSGDLFFDGVTFGGKFGLSEVNARQRYAHTIAVRGAKLFTPGFVQWDPQARALEVADQNCGNSRTTCIYQLQVVKKTAEVVKEIDLRTYRGTRVCDIVQAALFGGSLYGSDNESCGYADGATYDWRFPSGSPKSYTGKASSTWFGAAVAPKT